MSSKSRESVVEVSFVPAHFNTRAFAHIPETYKVSLPDGRNFLGDSEQDAVELAERFAPGATVRFV